MALRMIGKLLDFKAFLADILAGGRLLRLVVEYRLLYFRAALVSPGVQCGGLAGFGRSGRLHRRFSAFETDGGATAVPFGGVAVPATAGPGVGFAALSTGAAGASAGFSTTSAFFFASATLGSCTADSKCCVVSIMALNTTAMPAALSFDHASQATMLSPPLTSDCIPAALSCRARVRLPMVSLSVSDPLMKRRYFPAAAT